MPSEGACSAASSPLASLAYAPSNAALDVVRWSVYDFMRLQRMLEERPLPGEERRWKVELAYLERLEAEERARQSGADWDSGESDAGYGSDADDRDQSLSAS